MTHKKDKVDSKKPADTIYYNCLIWPVERREIKSGKRGRVNAVAEKCRIYGIHDRPEDVYLANAVIVDDPASLAAAIANCAPSDRRITAWIARGWQDMVLSGLTELMETGIISWKWCVLDGQRAMFSGKLLNRPFALTSLPCWTGGSWDEWREQVKEFTEMISDHGAITVGNADEATALAEIAAVLRGRRVFRGGRPALSMAAQSRGVWRNWLSPSCRPFVRKGRPLSQQKQQLAKAKTLPILERTDACRTAERQACYGLPREQYLYGHIDSPVEVWDLRGAYLSALASFRCPTAYLRREDHISPKALHDMLIDDVALALVEVNTRDNPYPVRIAGRTGRSVGSYWTWLAGAELEEALHLGHIVGVETAHIWAAHCMDRDAAKEVCALSDSLKEANAHAYAAWWRCCYAALVGQWAQWRRDWIDVELPSPFGRWASWTETDNATGIIHKYRCIAGRTQRREDVGEARHSCPMVYACITSAVRCIVDHFRRLIKPQHVVAQSSDALWIDVRGSAAFRFAVESQLSHTWTWRCKERYDDVWLNGKGAAVVRVDESFYPVMTGVPTHAEIGSDGRSRWMVSTPWNKDGMPSKKKGIRINTASFDVSRLMAENSFPAQPASPWLDFGAAILREELMKPCQ